MKRSLNNTILTEFVFCIHFKLIENSSLWWVESCLFSLSPPVVDMSSQERPFESRIHTYVSHLECNQDISFLTLAIYNTGRPQPSIPTPCPTTLPAPLLNNSSNEVNLYEQTIVKRALSPQDHISTCSQNHYLAPFWEKSSAKMNKHVCISWH